MGKTLASGPSDSPNIAVSSEGILSDAEQAKIENEVAAHVAALKKITDPAARFRAHFRTFAPAIKGLCELASAFPAVAPFAAAIGNAMEKMEARMDVPSNAPSEVSRR